MAVNMKEELMRLRKRSEELTREKLETDAQVRLLERLMGVIPQAEPQAPQSRAEQVLSETNPQTLAEVTKQVLRDHAEVFTKAELANWVLAECRGLEFNVKSLDFPLKGLIEKGAVVLVKKSIGQNPNVYRAVCDHPELQPVPSLT